MLRMAEQEAEHRRKTETTVVSAQIEHSNRQFGEARFGQVCALIITVVAIVAGVYTAIQGHEITGCIIGVGGIGGIVTTFIFGRRQTERSGEAQKPQEAADNMKAMKPSNKENR
jgi:uncharacterized membrane protein